MDSTEPEEDPPDSAVRRPAGKTLPPGFVFPDDPDSDSEDEDLEEEEPQRPGKRPCIEMLQNEVERLKDEIERLEGSKRRRRNFKPGSPQVLYLMNVLQRFYDTQHRQQGQHKEGSQGHHVRLMLTELVDGWMAELDEKATEEHYDWRKVPDRPHARRVVFNVNE